MKDSKETAMEEDYKFHDKSVLIIGSGKMGNFFAQALSKLGIKDVTVIGLSQDNVIHVCKKFGYHPLYGGYKKHLPKINTKDLVIVCTPIMDLLSATKLAIEFGQINILIEKPGSISAQELRTFKEELSNQNVWIAYNRLMYPSLKKLRELIIKDEGVTSCHFSFSEMLNRINFSNNPSIVYSRWGICNSLHVISMAFDLIGFPRKIYSISSGNLKWHKSGSVFVGCGITEKNILFSYNADWEYGGPWSIEITTKKHRYRLLPLEELYVQNTISYKWEKILFPNKFEDTKPGICAELLSIFNQNTEHLISIEKGIQLIQIANKIFRY